MGKTQLADPKPAAAFVDPSARFGNPEDNAELQEELLAVERKRQKESARANKVSTFLNDNSFRTDKTWVFMFWPVTRRQESVRYYFPKKKLAIDQFRALDKHILAEIEFKKKVLKANGIIYFPMLPTTKMLDLAEFI